jgi:tetratricopeptide (TPR) repeat protein
MSSRDPRASFRQAARLFEARRYPEARQQLLDLVKLAPRQPAVWQMLGLVHCLCGEDEAGEQAYLNALQLSPNDSQTLNNLAILYRKLGRFEESRDCYQRAVSVRPEFAEAWCNLGLLNKQLEEWHDAEAALRKALQIDPSNLKALVALGAALKELQRFEEAIEVLERVVQADPGHLQALHNLGVACKMAGRWDQAVMHLTRAAERAPEHPSVWHNLGSSLRLAGKTEQAEQALKKAIALEPGNLEHHHWLSELLWTQGRDDFLDSWYQARQADPGNVELRRQLGTHLMYAGRLDEAEQEFREALQFDPERVDVRHLLGSVLHEQERFDDALAEHETALAGSPGNITILDGLGHVLLGMGDAQRGLEIYDQLLAHQPGSMAWWAMKATALRMTGSEEYDWLYDSDRLLLVTEIEVPAGFGDHAEFNQALLHELERYHYDVRHPLHQSVKGGTQTADHLFHIDEPHIQLLKRALESRIHEFLAGLRPDPAHPVLAGITPGFEFIGAWSIRNPAGGFHLNHHHDEGWFSGPYYVNLPAVSLADDAEHPGWVNFGQPGFKMREPLPPDRFVLPKEGVMVLFPSYFWHGTVPFESSEYRVTVAHDIVRRERPRA